MFCRFDAFRKEQDILAHDVYNAFAQKKMVLCHAPTGIGKTDAVLSAALTFAYENDLSVFFVTPKNSQHKLAIDISNAINRKYRTDFVAIDLVGKKTLCTNPNVNNVDNAAFYYVCENYCSKNLCEFYSNTTNQYIWKEKARALGNAIISNMDASEFADICEGIGVCAYECSLRSARNATLIIGDYNHVFYPEIFNYLCVRSNKKPEKSLLIVDEAHNLPQRLNNRLSRKLSTQTIRRAYKEAKKYGLKQLKDQIKEFYFGYKSAMKKVIGKNTESLVSSEFLSFFPNYKEFAQDLITYGQKVIIKKRRMSSILNMGGFIADWENDEGFALIAEKKGLRLVKQCLDVKPLSAVASEFAGAVFMSGTLRPLDYYEKILGFSECIKKEYTDVFPPENKLVIHCPGFTTKYSQRTNANYHAIADKILSIFNTISWKTVVYFPSFIVLKEVANEFAKIGKNVSLLLQTEKMNQKQVKALAKTFLSSGDILFCVQGGSLAEGIEFKNNAVKCIIIVGIPLEQMSIAIKERIRYIENQFGEGTGIDYGYIVPAMTKVIQACGRLIRSETDYGVIIFLEDRMAWQNYKKYIPDSYAFVQTHLPEKLLKSFKEHIETKNFDVQKTIHNNL